MAKAATPVEQALPTSMLASGQQPLPDEDPSARQNGDAGDAHKNGDGPSAVKAPEERCLEIRPGGMTVELFNDNIFCELRAYAQVPDDLVNEGWNLKSLRNGGGKGGTLMAFVGTSFIVKELSAGDHKVLLALARSYGAHVRSGETMICPIYLHFCEPSSGRFFFAMRNVVGSGPFVALYDLKACADDKTIEENGKPVKAVHKRIWNLGLWCGKCRWTEERARYFEGKQAAREVTIPLMEDQRTKVLQCIRRDTQWLASNQLMDYSLLVAVKEGSAPGTSASGGSGPSTLGRQPVVQADQGSNVSLHVSIIDFLQEWTAGKKIARCLKSCEQNKATVPPAYYAERFASHFEARFEAIPRRVPEIQASGPAAVAPAAGGFNKMRPPVAPPPLAMCAPAIGDIDDEGRPEDRLYSRGMSSNGGTPCVSRQHPDDMEAHLSKQDVSRQMQL